MTDHYTTLNIPKTASPEDIKKAYRRLASQHHPDKGGDKQKFQEIQAAYDTLSDPQSRATYDNPQPEMQGFHFGGGMPPGFEDIFGAAFGAGHPFEHIFGRRTQQRNRTMNMQTTISLEEAFHGKELIAQVDLPSGRPQTLQIKIPPGIQDGNTLRLAGIGDDSFPNLPRGDINLTVSVLPHPVFQRRGDDLVTNLKITCIDAMLGRNISVSTIDGKTLDVTINPGTQHGTMLAAQGYGMPAINDPRFRGRLLMEIHIYVPDNLTENQKQSLRNNFY